MYTRLITGVLIAIAAPVWTPAQELSPFPAGQSLLARHNFRGLHQFAEWRRGMIDAVRKTIEEPVPEDYRRPQGNETHIAIVWAGELRAAELIPLLVRHIDLRVFTKEPLLREDLYPAVRALILIGKASSVACLSALHVEQHPVRRENMVLVIRHVDGEKGALLLIRKAMEEETDARKKANLEAALKLASSPQSP